MHGNRLKYSPDELFQFIKRSIDEYGVPPTYNEIMDALGMKSSSIVKNYLDILEKRGLIKQSGTSRGIKVIGFRQVTIEDLLDGADIEAIRKLIEETKTYSTDVAEIRLALIAERVLDSV